MMVSPADYYASQRPSGPPEGRFELDMGGSQGALSNGTVTLGGVDWTLSGVGDTAVGSQIKLETPLANIYADYDGAKHTVEICVDEYETSSIYDHRHYVEILRRNPTTNYYNGFSQYRYLSNRALYAIQALPSYTSNGYVTTSDPLVIRKGVFCGGNVTKTGYYDGSVPVVGFREPFRVEELNDTFSGGLGIDYPAGANFDTTDVLQIRIITDTGASTPASGHSATQTANGVKLLYGTVRFSIHKIYLYFGTADI